MQVVRFSKQIIDKRSNSSDIKVFAFCWVALSAVVVDKNYECATELLNIAWNKAIFECENCVLLAARVLRHFAFMQYDRGNRKKALKCMSLVKEVLFNAAPSNETAHALYTDLLVKKPSIPSCASSSQFQSFEKDCELLLEHTKYAEEYEKPAVFSFFRIKALFHLRSDLIADELPPKEYWPSPDDLRKAEGCLKNVALDIMSQSNLYKVRYFCTICDLYIWKQDYRKAVCNLEEARKLSKMPCINQRLQLIERLKGGDNSDETDTF